MSVTLSGLCLFTVTATSFFIFSSTAATVDCLNHRALENMVTPNTAYHHTGNGRCRTQSRRTFFGVVHLNTESADDDVMTVCPVTGDCLDCIECRRITPLTLLAFYFSSFRDFLSCSFSFSSNISCHRKGKEEIALCVDAAQ